MAVAPSPVYEEVYRFLLSSPTTEQIIGFHASEATQVRVRELLTKNEDGLLSSADQNELDEFESVNHFVSMLKIYAWQQLSGQR